MKGTQTLSPPKCETCPTSLEDVNCLRCPVCGTEECMILDQLGNYCETRTAVALAAVELSKGVSADS